MLLKAYLPALDASLGLFIPLIVVNCIILGRAEMFANKNSVIDSALDGIGMGVGFSLTLTAMGLIREFFGSGTLFDMHIYGGSISPMTIFMLEMCIRDRHCMEILRVVKPDSGSVHPMGRFSVYG